MKKIYINADDFGFSQGVNLAIYKGSMEGIINSTSIMVNQECTKEAIQLSRKMKNIDLGLHVTLTTGRAVCNKNKLQDLTEADGFFCNGFVKLLLKTVYLKRIKFQIWREIEAQIKIMQKNNLSITHMDGHRHIQMIPMVYKIMRKLQKKYKISRMRIINESIYNTWKNQGQISGIKNGGIVKLLVLTVLGWLTKAKSEIYFFSIIYTGNINTKILQKVRVPEEYNGIEIMLHPGLPDVDKQNINSISDKNIISHTREVEFLTALNKDCLKGLKDDKSI